jgi:CRP/FNR family transcriptional regulator, dissimilatory nitrate respiration regulator
MFTDATQELHALLPEHLVATCVAMEVAKGSTLFKARQKPAHMYFVVSGEVVLERPGLHGSPVILQRTRRGFVSEASLQSPSYHCHGQVVAPTRLIQLPIRPLREALDADPAFSGRWISMLNKEVKRLRLQCERLSLTKVQERLVHLLETEGEHGKFPVGAGIKLMAGELGVTHEALYRCIASMEKAGTLQRGDGWLRLVA